MQPEKIDINVWKQDIPDFVSKTADFYAGTLSKIEYKGVSGYYGSYAQRGGRASMLRLRMSAGRVTLPKLAFTAAMIRRYGVKMIHFTTCQNIQLHNLSGKAAGEIMQQALEAGIVTIGGGGDYPRNVMCSPLSGAEQGEYFDVMPYAEAVSDYLMHFVKEKKLPRKLKTGFSSTPDNLTHATFRDLGFAARPDGKFDVYSAGGLGNNPRLGVKMAEAAAPEKLLYYVKAMWLTFSRYGNYASRGKARTRYMQESFGSPEAYLAAYNEVLQEVMASGEDLDLHIRASETAKCGEGVISGFRITPQKQQGLYAVSYHPAGGVPCIENFLKLADYLQTVPAAEVRMSPDESMYIINLTAAEAARVIALTPDSAAAEFAESVACIGSQICQQGMGDSQKLLHDCLELLAGYPAAFSALPKIYISGCPSSCGTHQTGSLGFRGTVKVISRQPQPAFNLYVNGCARQGSERFAEDLGVILAEDIPSFLLETGRCLAAAGKKFDEWYSGNPQPIRDIAARFTEKINTAK